MTDPDQAFIRRHVELEKGERVLLVARKSLLALWWRIALSVALVSLPFFLMFPLFRNWDSLGVMIFALLLGLAAYYTGQTWVLWRYNAFILTDRRLVDIDQRGLADRRVSEATLDRVTDASFRKKGVLATIFNLGTVLIETKGKRAMIQLAGMRDPKRLHEAIQLALRRYEPGDDEPTESEDDPDDTADADDAELMRDVFRSNAKKKPKTA